MVKKIADGKSSKTKSKEKGLESVSSVSKKDPQIIAYEQQVKVQEKLLEDIAADHKVSTEQFLTFYKKNHEYPEGWRAGVSAINYYLQKVHLIL